MKTASHRAEPVGDEVRPTVEQNSRGSVRVLQRAFREAPAPRSGPHRRVNDELCPLDEHTLLGLSFGLPLAPRGDAPFILHRRDEGP